MDKIFDAQTLVAVEPGTASEIKRKENWSSLLTSAVSRLSTLSDTEVDGFRRIQLKGWIAQSQVPTF